MAGSYSHITDDEGRFIGLRLIENLGDAHEMAEEMYGMIWALARALDDRGPTKLGQMGSPERGAAAQVEWARLNYRAGLTVSPTET